jgi:hemolysin activation/secretion protein
MGGEIDAGFTGLLGFGDELGGAFDVTEGLKKYQASYRLPVNARGTLLALNAEYSDAEVVESPFDDLDIENTFQSYAIGIFDPVYESSRTRFVLGAAADWRRSKTSLLGSGFSFPGTGTEDGRATAAILRFSGEWVRRDRDQVLAARSMLSLGLDVLGATEHRGKVPDGQFVAWLGQVQWARRFGPWGIEAIFRTDVQLSNDPLLSMEQFPVGGHDSLRGYRENQLVRDQGIVSSVEIRVPIWESPRWRSRVQLAPFFDIGRSWSHDRVSLLDGEPRPNPSSKTLASVGIGLRCEITRYLYSEIYWGHQLDDVATSGDLQDDGVQFRSSVDFP